MSALLRSPCLFQMLVIVVMVAGIARAGTAPPGKTPPVRAPGAADVRDQITAVPTKIGDANLLKHDGRVQAIAFSPDGKLLASGAQDKVVRVWDLASGVVKHQIERPAGVAAVAFSPDGARLAAAHAGPNIPAQLTMWDAKSWQEIPAPPAPPKSISCIDFHRTRGVALPAIDRRQTTVKRGGAADAQQANLLMATSSSDGKARLYDLTRPPDEMLLREFDCTDMNSPPDQYYIFLNSVAFSPNGKLVATVGNDHRIILWDAATGERTRVIKQAPHLYDVSFTPDGKLVGGGGDAGLLRLWDVATGNIAKDFPNGGFLGPATYCTALSPDGKTLASSGGKGPIQLWDIETVKPKQTLQGHTEMVNCMAFSRDGSRLASGGGDNTVRIWQLGAAATASPATADPAPAPAPAPTPAAGPAAEPKPAAQPKPAPAPVQPVTPTRRRPR